MVKNARTMSMSIQGGFINDLALEKCHQDYDVCYAVDLLMSCLQTDQLSEGDRLMLALRVLNGEVEIRGTYPGDDYGPVELETRKEGYDIRATINGMRQKLGEKDKEIGRLYNMLACCGEHLGYSGMRAVNNLWRHEFGEDGLVFEDAENPPELVGGLLGEALERIRRNDSDEDYGWLEPSGTFHPVEWGEHEEWACEQVKLKGWLEEWTLRGDGSIRSFGDFLVYRRGWVLLHNPAQGLARPTVSDTRPMTKAQREFLFDYYTERNRTDLAKKYLEDE